LILDRHDAQGRKRSSENSPRLHQSNYIYKGQENDFSSKVVFFYPKFLFGHSLKSISASHATEVESSELQISSTDLSAEELPTELDATVAVQLQTLEQDTMGKSWYNALKGEFEMDYFHKVCLIPVYRGSQRC